ncbi:MAG: branched-chain amino acid ABC transporter permease [Dehalococcoidia bacterium]|nr:MAG: branched-chain amino acid ABC transporter permease [Dehalococcoidia bacterium]
MDTFLQFFISGILNGGIYALIGIGLVLIFKASGIFNFAVGQLLLVGAFATWAFLKWLELPVWLSVLLAMVVAALVGLIIERLVTRPLIGQPVLSAVMALLALSVMLKGVFAFIFGPATVSYPADVLPGTPVSLSGASFSGELTWGFLIAVIVFGIVTLLFYRSRIGLAMRGTAEDHQLAQATGINVKHIFAITWMAAVLVAAIGGIIIGSKVGIGIHFTPLLGVKVIPVVLFGGLESIKGCFVAGLIVGILESIVGGYVDPNLMVITPYAILLLVLLFRPYGLFGQKRIERI